MVISREMLVLRDLQGYKDLLDQRYILNCYDCCYGYADRALLGNLVYPAYLVKMDQKDIRDPLVFQGLLARKDLM